MADDIFAFCCGIMTGLGDLLHLNYMTVNVILFCYIEPIFTGLMLLLAFLSKYEFPIRKPGIWFFWIVVGVVGLLLFLGGINYYVQGGSVPGMGYYNHIDQLTEPLFHMAVCWLEDTAVRVGTSYEAVNLILFVLFIPGICIVSYIVMNYPRQER